MIIIISNCNTASLSAPGRLREGPFGGHLPEGTAECDIVKGSPPDYCFMAGMLTLFFIILFLNNWFT